MQRNQFRQPLRQSLAQPAAPALREEFFSYGTTFLALANGAALTQSIQIQADSDFELQKLTCFDGTPNGQGGHPLATIQLIDTGTGRQLFNTPQLIPTVFGTGELPFILPVTRLFTANSVLQVQVSNLSGAQMDLYLSFLGAKIYR